MDNDITDSPSNKIIIDLDSQNSDTESDDEDILDTEQYETSNKSEDSSVGNALLTVVNPLNWRSEFKLLAFLLIFYIAFMSIKNSHKAAMDSLHEEILSREGHNQGKMERAITQIVKEFDHTSKQYQQTISNLTVSSLEIKEALNSTSTQLIMATETVQNLTEALNFKETSLAMGAAKFETATAELAKCSAKLAETSADLSQSNSLIQSVVEK